MGWNILRPSHTHPAQAATPPDAMQHTQEPSGSQGFLRPRNLAPASISPPNRNSSIAYMGQNYSRTPQTAGHSPLAAKGIALGNAAASTAAQTGLKLKRAFAGRRKKLEDDSPVSAGSSIVNGREGSPDRRPLPPVPQQGGSRPSPKQKPMQIASQVPTTRRPVPPAAAPPPPPKPVILQTPKRPLPTALPIPAPAPAPARTKADAHASVMSNSPTIAAAVDYMRAEASRDKAMAEPIPVRPLEPQRRTEPLALRSENEVVRPQTPEQQSPLQPPQQSSPHIFQQHPREAVKWEEEPARHHFADEHLTRAVVNTTTTTSNLPPYRHEEQVQRDPERMLTLAEVKEAWRKSDSATSHHTVTPRVGGNRTSRPVSMAESTRTIRRLSTMVTDAEFATLEEDEPGNVTMPEQRKSPASSVKAMNRRSLSLNLGSVFYNNNNTKSPPAPPVVRNDFKYGNPPPRAHIVARETPTLTKAAANGFIAPSTSADSPQSTGNNIRGRLAAWTAATNANGAPERPPNAIPPRHPQRPTLGLGVRTTATSISSNFGPAAGMAKRAVERMGRVWGGAGVNNSGYSSSSSVGRAEGSTAPSSYSSSGSGDENLRRTTSNQSNQGLGANAAAYLKGKTRRTPNAPSGSWSVASFATSSSASDSEVAGPSLGYCVRGPLRTGGGILFGRDLAAAVRETAIGVRTSPRHGHHVEKPIHARMRSATPGMDLKQLEKRKLPAIVVRCAQHLMLWGVQEEGLFRVSGRPSHVTKIRTGFDMGADYDMSECTPGDLDPHAVASVFKAYLRELPEPILTYALAQYFDAAMASESESTAAQPHAERQQGMKGPGLPTGPKGDMPMMRKPPSLSTLAMPNFQGMKPPSEPLLNAIRALVSRLPAENRDLIRTVAELIRATAKQSKETKMPLSNLLLVFCPSLSMSPPLLRVLCEAEGIWEARVKVEEVPVVNINRQTVLDIRSPICVEEDDEDEGKDEVEGVDETPLSPSAVLREKYESLAQPPASNGDSEVRKVRRVPLPVDTGRRSSHERRQDVPYDRSIQDDNSSTSDARSTASPPFSSSVESLATPSTSSGQPSYSELPRFNQPWNDMKATPIVRPASPEIAESGDMSINGARPRLRPNISGPISGPFPFPGTGSAPPTPIARRKSTPLLSFPGLGGSNSDCPDSPTSPGGKTRMKRPSLHLLFNKKTGSPVPSAPNSVYLSPSSSPYLKPRSASDTSVVTPVTALSERFASNTSVLPPQLEFTLETSPLKFGMGMDVEQEAEFKRRAERESSATLRGTSTPSPPLIVHPEGTPIADFYRTPASSTLDLLSPASPAPVTHLRATPGRLGLAQRAQAAQKSMYKINNASSSSLLSLDDDGEEDWAKTVLLAADADGQWRIDDSYKTRN